MSKESKIVKIKNPLYTMEGQLGEFINGLRIVRSCSNVLYIRTIATSYNKGTYFYNSADNRQGYRICLRKIK